MMLETGRISELITRIRGGDQEAAADLVREYEPLIRREVRLRLEDRRLRRTLDSMDLCQSVWAGFFLRANAGHYELDEPGQLLRLLVTIARNKVAAAARYQHRQKRDGRRMEGGDDALGLVADSTPTPSQAVGGAELLRNFRNNLTLEERELADLRAEGLAWSDIAERLGGTPQARRVQLARAVERVIRKLGVDEGDLQDD